MRTDAVSFILFWLLILSVKAASAAPIAITSTFNMLDESGTIINRDVNVSGYYDPHLSTFEFTSSIPLYGYTWSMHAGTLYAPGSYMISTADSFTSSCDTSYAVCASGGDVTFDVPDGHVGGHMKFAWRDNDGIDVFLIWDRDGHSIDFSTTGFAADGIDGFAMLDGVFTGYSFDFDIYPAIFYPPIPTPIPATAWLFGSGLLGLAGVARRKKAG